MYKCYRLSKFLCVVSVCLIFIIGAIAVTVNGFKSVAVNNSETIISEENEVQEALSRKGIFVPVIMYHSLLEDSSRHGEYVLSPQDFYNDMEYLKSNGYTTIFVSDIIDYIENDDTELPEKPVIVSFDDGYYNIMHYAYPYLKENGMKAVMSVVGSYTVKATDENEHNPTYSALTWDEIAELSNSGVFEIGNHTYDMHSLSGRKGSKKLYNESDEDYRKTLFDDIGSFQGLLTDKSNVTPVIFAYPYGLISSESKSILSDMGFKVMLTCLEKPNYIIKGEEYPLMLSRYNRPSGISTEVFMAKALKK